MIEIEKNDIQFYAEDFDFSLSHELQYKDWLIIKKFVRYLQKNMNFY